MDSKDENFGINDFNSDISESEPKKTNLKKKITLIIIISVVFIIVLLIAYFIIFNSPVEEKKESILGEINCIYDIQNTNKEIQILGDDFSNSENIEIYIDDELIKYSKNLKFSSIGSKSIKYKLYNNVINMDNMFKDISSIISVDMSSSKNVEIISMISTFENSSNLELIIITMVETNNINQ